MINIANMPRAYSEVYALLRTVEDEYRNKIPEKIYYAIKDNRDFNYNPKYSENQAMTKDIISKEALSLIAALNLQYWCEDEEEKKRLKKCYIENGKREKEKYSYENLFKIDTIEKIKTEDIAEEEKKEHNLPIKIERKNIFERMVSIVKNLIRRR